MTEEYTSTIKLRTIPAGRTGFAARKVEALAAKLEAAGGGHAATRVRLVAAALLLQARKARKMRNLYLTGRNYKKPRRGRTRYVDNDADRLISSIHQQGYRVTQNFPATHELGQRARRFLEVAFGVGLPAIIHVPFEEQLMQMELLWQAFQTTLAADIGPLGLTMYMDRYEELLEAYRVELNVAPAQVVTHAQVKEAEKRCQVQLAQTVAVILGQFYELDDPEDAANRTALLAPILEQDAAVAKYNRQRRRVVDVDPATGEELTELDEEPTPS